MGQNADALPDICCKIDQTQFFALGGKERKRKLKASLCRPQSIPNIRKQEGKPD